MPDRLTWLKDGLWALTLAGLFAGVLRFGLGLGAASGLNDVTPWGLWIAFKLCFVALAGGGFTLAAMVYIFHLESYRPLLRRAILLALLGYGSFIVSLLFDLGLPWHIYMPIIHWQHHSVMFEIAWCVMLYFSVLLMEFGPVILEHPLFAHPLFQRLLHLLKRATLPLVIAGIVLSTLHQSSLGALFLIMPQRVHPLWYSPWIPPLFFISAIAAGMLALIVEGYLAQALFGRGLQRELLEGLGRLAAFALALYLGLRLGDLALRGVLPAALDGSWPSLWFGMEVLIGGLLPLALLSIPAVRRRPEGLLTAALLGLGGIASQRLSLSMITMWRPFGVPYRPSLLEIIIAFAIPAAAGLIYLLFMEQLAVTDRRLPQPHALRPSQPGFQGAFARRSGLAVFVLALSVAALPARQAQGQTLPLQPVHTARGWETLTLDGNADGRTVLFPHSEHQQRLDCAACHHLAAPGDENTPCSQCHQNVYAVTSIFDHTRHLAFLNGQAPGNAVCAECHAGEHRAQTAVACSECHEHMRASPNGGAFSPLAPGYIDALHTRCRGCHQQEARSQARPALDQCSTCHGFLPPEPDRLALQPAGKDTYP